MGALEERASETRPTERRQGRVREILASERLEDSPYPHPEMLMRRVSRGSSAAGAMSMLSRSTTHRTEGGRARGLSEDRGGPNLGGGQRGVMSGSTSGTGFGGGCSDRARAEGSGGVGPSAPAECRICYEGAAGGPLLQPCGCHGTLGHVHLECLTKWCQERRSTRCEICGKECDGGAREHLVRAVQRAQRRQQQHHAADIERLMLAEVGLRGLRMVQANGEILVFFDPAIAMSPARYAEHSRRHACRSLLLVSLVTSIFFIIAHVYASPVLEAHQWLDITFKFVAFLVATVLLAKAMRVYFHRRGQPGVAGEALTASDAHAAGSSVAGAPSRALAVVGEGGDRGSGQAPGQGTEGTGRGDVEMGTWAAEASQGSPRQASGAGRVPGDQARTTRPPAASSVRLGAPGHAHSVMGSTQALALHRADSGHFLAGPRPGQPQRGASWRDEWGRSVGQGQV